MPRVPNYDSPQVLTNPMPTVRQSPSDFLSQTSENIGQQAFALQEKMQQQRDMDAVLSADSALSDNYLQWEVQARQREGVNAQGLTQEATKWWDDNLAKAKENLASGAQQKAFDQIARRRREQSLNSFALQEAVQTKKAADDAAKASIVSSINLAARYVGTPLETSALSAGKGDVIARVKALSALHGWSAEEYEVQEADALTNFHKQILGNMMDVAPDRARQYFEINKQEINGTEYDSIDKALVVGAGKAEAQKLSDYAAANGMTQQQGLDYIRENAPLGDTRDIAETEWMRRFQQDRIAREGLQKDYADKAWNIFSRAGSLSRIPAEVRAGMDGKDWEALKAHARSVAQGHTVKTDPATWLDVHDAIVKGQPVDLRQYLNKLSQSDIEQLAKLQSHPADGLKDAASLSEQLGNAHDMMAFDSSDKEDRGLFDKAVTDAVQQEAVAKGHALNYDERQKIIDRMMLEGRINREWWPDKTGRAYKFAGKPEASRFIPDDERTKVIEALKRAKIPVTEDSILALYHRAHP